QPIHGADELAALVAGEEELVHLVDERRVVDGEDLPQHRAFSPAAVRPPAPASDLAARNRRDRRGGPEPVKLCITEGGERSMLRGGPLPVMRLRAGRGRRGARGSRPGWSAAARPSG